MWGSQHQSAVRHIESDVIAQFTGDQLGRPPLGLSLQIFVQSQVKASDPRLLIIPQRDAFAGRFKTPLLQLQIPRVLIVNRAQPGQFVYLGVGLLHRQMHGFRGVRVLRAVGEGLQHENLKQAAVGVIADGSEPIGHRNQRAGEKERIGEQVVLDRVEHLAVGYR